MKTLPIQLFLTLLSEDILKTINKTADPCDDFYKFACGHYKKVAPLHKDEISTGTFKNLNNLVERQLAELFDEPPKISDPLSQQFLRSYFDSCMNTDALAKVGWSPMKELISSYGGWPMVMGKRWRKKDYHWTTTEARLFRKLSFMTLLNIYKDSDVDNSSINIAQLDELFLALRNRDYYLDKKYENILNEYRKLIVQTAVELGANRTIATKEAKDVVNLEIALATIKKIPVAIVNKTETSNKMTIATFVKRMNSTQYKVLFKKLKLFGWHYTNETIINVPNETYFQKLQSILSSTPKRTIANYQIWRIVKRYLPALDPGLLSASRHFESVLYGKSDKQPKRTQTCIAEVSQQFPNTLSYMYVKRYTKPNDSSKVVEMIANLRKAMAHEISGNSWMDEETKLSALEKLNKMEAHVGYPSYIMNETKRMFDTAGTVVGRSNYFNDTLGLHRAGFLRFIRELREPSRDWFLPPFTVNAGAVAEQNSILFPAAILQYPFYDSKAPAFMNYGRIGFVIGHEITHHFDGDGSQYDSNGSVSSWWTNDSLTKYLNKSQCFIDQYSSVYDPEVKMNLDGKITLDENIADNGGIRIAYRAYHDYLVQHGGKDIVPKNLEQFTKDQLFFIASGQTFCWNKRLESMRHMYKNSEHSPDNHRINLAFKNFEAFAKAFKCRPGTGMNPEKKCRIW